MLCKYVAFWKKKTNQKTQNKLLLWTWLNSFSLAKNIHKELIQIQNVLLDVPPLFPLLHSHSCVKMSLCYLRAQRNCSGFLEELGRQAGGCTCTMHVLCTFSFFFLLVCQQSFLAGKTSFSSGIKFLKELVSHQGSRELSISLSTFQRAV